ncbi:MAG: hypothetical protein U0531_08710 [Dehalococcoidia bacterium]
MTTAQLGPLGQVSRRVRDAGRDRLHRDVLGLRHLYSFPSPVGELAFFDCGGTRLFLSAEGDGAPSVLYFTVADINAAYDELRGRGVVFVDAPHLIVRHADGVEEWMAFLRDDATCWRCRRRAAPNAAPQLRRPRRRTTAICVLGGGRVPNRARWGAPADWTPGMGRAPSLHQAAGGAIDADALRHQPVRRAAVTPAAIRGGRPEAAEAHVRAWSVVGAEALGHHRARNLGRHRHATGRRSAKARCALPTEIIRRRYPPPPPPPPRRTGR